MAVSACNALFLASTLLVESFLAESLEFLNFRLLAMWASLSPSRKCTRQARKLANSSGYNHLQGFSGGLRKLNFNFWHSPVQQLEFSGTDFWKQLQLERWVLEHE
jgi:hypothetical protein